MSGEAVGRAAGKAILLGEHAVVHGEPALAAALPIGVEAAARPAAGPLAVHVSSWDYRAAIGDGSEGGRALEALALSLGLEPRGVALEALAEVPPRAGLGSSAALAAAAARGLIALAGADPGEAKLFEAVQASERVFHGNPSGLDAAVALRGGLLRFRRGAEPLALEAAVPPLVICHSGEPGRTRLAVEAFARRLESSAEAKQRLARIGELVSAGEESLLGGDLVSLGRAINENHEQLAWFGVSTPALDRICSVARELGALGAKLTGGGAGGCAIALVEPQRRARLAAELAAAGVEVVR
ncbi:MAG: mevalonate kinase [Polyangia bacterium]